MLVVSTHFPRFTFVPRAEHVHPGPTVAMSAYRIVVVAGSESDRPPAVAGAAAAAAWDSGIVNATAAVSVRCGTKLDSMTSYTWSTQWWSVDGRASPTTSSSFEVGPVTTDDWVGARWVGA